MTLNEKRNAAAKGEEGKKDPQNEPADKQPRQQGERGGRNKRQKRQGRYLEGIEGFSHALTWALRHQGPKLGLTMTSDGFVPVQEILDLKHPRFVKAKTANNNTSSTGNGWTLQDIQQVVETCSKQRFQLQERPAIAYQGRKKKTKGQQASQENGDGSSNTNTSTILCIRATQGHSLDCVDRDMLLTRLSAQELEALPVIVHGTYLDAWTKGISKQGLHRMKRNHIHLTTGKPNQGEIISGMRTTCNCFVYVDAKKCAQDGIAFYKSANGVLLTAGPGNQGTLPIEYFLFVENCSGNILFDRRVEQNRQVDET